MSIFDQQFDLGMLGECVHHKGRNCKLQPFSVTCGLQDLQGWLSADALQLNSIWRWVRSMQQKCDIPKKSVSTSPTLVVAISHWAVTSSTSTKPLSLVKPAVNRTCLSWATVVFDGLNFASGHRSCCFITISIRCGIVTFLWQEGLQEFAQGDVSLTSPLLYISLQWTLGRWLVERRDLEATSETWKKELSTLIEDASYFIFPKPSIEYFKHRSNIIETFDWMANK